ncbi:MAG: hypothetical protein II453_07915 [Alphaproteobacteria bacterium]|nr:hypothetical protein [Alphaproteobacteria bacterium]
MNTVLNLQIPSSWEGVTINQMIKLQEVKSNDLKSLIKLVKIFNPDIDPTEMEIEVLLQVANSIYDVITKQAEPENKTEYIIDGVTYHIANPEALDFGEFLDVNSLNSNDEAEQIRNLPLILSLITVERPDDAVKAWAGIIADKVDVCTALGCVLFFSENLMEFIKNSPVYSQISNLNNKASENAK